MKKRQIQAKNQNKTKKNIKMLFKLDVNDSNFFFDFREDYPNRTPYF